MASANLAFVMPPNKVKYPNRFYIVVSLHLLGFMFLGGASLLLHFFFFFFFTEKNRYKVIFLYGHILHLLQMAFHYRPYKSGS